MVVPFKYCVDGRGVFTVVKKTLNHLNNTLSRVCISSWCKGGFDPSWKGYYTELALEKFHFGHPLSPSNAQRSQILRISTSRRNSVTLMRRFLCLTPHSQATFDQLGV